MRITLVCPVSVCFDWLSSSHEKGKPTSIRYRNKIKKITNVRTKRFSTIPNRVCVCVCVCECVNEEREELKKKNGHTFIVGYENRHTSITHQPTNQPTIYKRALCNHPCVNIDIQTHTHKKKTKAVITKRKRLLD